MSGAKERVAKVSVALTFGEVADLVTALRVSADAAEALSLRGEEAGPDIVVATVTQRYRKLASRLAASAKKASGEIVPVREAHSPKAVEDARLRRLLEEKRCALINLGVFPGKSPVRERLKAKLEEDIADLAQHLAEQATPARRRRTGAPS